MRSKREASVFIEANYARLSRLSAVIASNDSDAADLLHDALERLYRKWNFAEVSNPWGLAKTIMVRTNIDRHRKLRRELLVSDPTEAPLITNVAEHDGLLNALRQLPAKQRTAIALRYLEDMSMAEIAEDLNCTEGTVRSHISRGTERLRILLSQIEAKGQR